jgi:hypothetical protein
MSVIDAPGQALSEGQVYTQKLRICEPSRTRRHVSQPSTQLLPRQEAYNTTWLIERHGYITRAALRQKQLQPVARAA